ncbi:MAG TPA: 4'-phosphopantetheinyl transferase superfamily protein [Pseudonocardiaceae bacterium]|jgi:malonyl CoA-acyl carrier protein transacylase/phosphopantetheinyl transferase|nr:4'-phosphopantetheinyl transferase superfamily protein [Pseudonocardiaceae bacterium]
MAEPTGVALAEMAADLPRTPAPTGAERVLLLAGASADELQRQLQSSETDLLGRDDGCAPPRGGPCRLAIVAPTARQLTLARKIVAQRVPWRGRNDVWFTGAPLHSEHAPGRLAFLFPGLEQAFTPRVDDVADYFGLARLELGDTAVLGRHGLAVLAVGRLLDVALRELGVIPDLVAGHSVGEWNAMIAAGVYPTAAVEEFGASFDLDGLRVPGLVFAALGCGAQQAAHVIDGLDGVVVSHDNCPHQSIVCGEEAAVAAALDRLRARGATGQVLPFRSGFHSPMLAPYLDPILDVFAGLPVRVPTVAIWSATTVERYPDDPAGIRDLAARHLLEPVRFGPLVRRLYAEGVRAFVQVGSGSLPGFVADALEGSAHLAIAANTAKRSGLDQLRRVMAALWVEGWEPRFDRLQASSPARPAEFRTAKHPVLAEFESVLQDVTAAARAIVESWSATTTRPLTRLRPTTTWPATRTRATTPLVLSLDTMPYLADHCLVKQPADWPEAADRYPVVPLTTLMELMMQAARDLVPGRTVVGVRDVRALRFLAVAPAVTAAVDAELDTDGNVAVTIDGYARGTAMLADGYPEPPDGPLRPLRGERPCEVTTAALYEDRWMFHGPRFQGITELGPIGDDGVRGVFAASSAPGALLDNAGQLLGFWIMKRMSGNRLAYPAAVEQVRWYGPRPHPGDRVSCVVRIGSVTDTDVVADLELRSGGRLWARIDRWTSRRFGTDHVTWPMFLFPERNRIAQRQAGGWFLARDRWPDPGSRELIMRQYLGAAERAEYSQRTPRAARQWLLGRIAVKDAVRQWLWDAGAGPMHPVEVTVGNHPSGRPWVTGPFTEPLEVSLTHTGSLAAALVGPPGRGPRGVGIDLEQVADRDERTVAAILTDAERHLLDSVCSSGTERPSWVTRFWVAKEAVAKAAGTGLGGRPHQFTVERVDADRLLVTTGDGASTRWVQTELGAEVEPYAVAWTPLKEGTSYDS